LQNRATNHPIYYSPRCCEELQKFGVSGRILKSIIQSPKTLNRKLKNRKPKRKEERKRYFLHYRNGKYTFVNLSLKNKGHQQQ